MVQTKAIKTKISSVQWIKKITNALEIVSTVKFQKVKAKTDSFLSFLKQYIEIVAKTAKFPTLAEESKSGRDLVVLITTEKGLCGSINTKTLKVFDSRYGSQKDTVDVIAIGKKGKDFCRKMWYTIIADFSISDDFSDTDIDSLYRFLQKHMHVRWYQHVSLVYTGYVSPMVQNPHCVTIFPCLQHTVNDALQTITDGAVSYDGGRVPLDDIRCEPTADEYIQEISKQYARFLVYGAILQAKSSEFAARMLAMKNAKENSTTMIADLQLQYNKARQWAVTQEISEIVGAKSAME